MLSFYGAIPDFPLPTDSQGALQSMMRLTFIESDLSATLHIGVEQPFDDEQGPLDTPNFAKGDGQIMLPWPRRQFLQGLARLHPARKHRCDAAQDIWPIGVDGIFADAVTY